MIADDALVEFTEQLPKLLIVDDEALIRDSLKTHGTGLGFQVYTAND